MTDRTRNILIVIALLMIGAATPVPPSPPWITLADDYTGRPIRIRVDAIKTIEDKPYTSPSTGQTQYSAIIGMDCKWTPVRQTIAEVEKLMRDAK